jgi:nicotinate-nucleotide pyrophosphorylase (carboxylating)
MTARPQPPGDTVVAADVTRAVREDLGDGDRTAALIPAEKRLVTRVICREIAILCGRPWFDETFRQLDHSIRLDWQAGDGDTVHRNQEVCRLEGPARGLLSGERTALNFLETLSGTATQTRRLVDALRLAQKYAVRCGGGSNHRIGLFDAILVKENHIAAAGSITAAVQAALRQSPGLLLEVEVEDLEQLEEACETGAHRALLDNFSLRILKTAVARFKGRIELEASGGIDLDSVRAVAETGVDFISAGCVTKNLQATDFSMRYVD